MAGNDEKRYGPGGLISPKQAQAEFARLPGDDNPVFVSRESFDKLQRTPGGEAPLKKQEDGKVRFDLIPPEVEYALAAVLTYGARKHSDRGWERHLNDPDFYDQIYAALRRHLYDDRTGKLRDKETNMLHLSHAFCDLAMLLTWRLRRGD